MLTSDEQLAFLSHRIHQAHKNAVNAELARRGLSEIGHPMLMGVMKGYCAPESDGLAQRELAALLHISPAAVANSLKSLERGGYIHREPRAGDARCNRVLLTEKGRRAVQGCDEAMEAVSQRMLSGFTPQEREQLLAFRQRMLENLEGPDACSTPNLKGGL